MVALMYFDTMQSVSVIPGLSFSVRCLLALVRLNPEAVAPTTVLATITFCLPHDPAPK